MYDINNSLWITDKDEEDTIVEIRSCQNNSETAVRDNIIRYKERTAACYYVHRIRTDRKNFYNETCYTKERPADENVYTRVFVRNRVRNGSAFHLNALTLK